MSPYRRLAENSPKQRVLEKLVVVHDDPDAWDILRPRICVKLGLTLRIEARCLTNRSEKS